MALQYLNLLVVEFNQFINTYIPIVLKFNTDVFALNQGVFILVSGVGQQCIPGHHWPIRRGHVLLLCLVLHIMKIVKLLSSSQVLVAHAHSLRCLNFGTLNSFGAERHSAI